MSEIKVDKISGKTSANAITVTGENGSTQTSLQQGLAKAWVNENNDATLDDSFNISGGVDNGTGDYTYSFTNNLGNINYSVTAICVDNNAEICHNNSRATSSYTIRIKEGDNGTTERDRPQSGTLHGDLA